MVIAACGICATADGAGDRRPARQMGRRPAAQRPHQVRSEEGRFARRLTVVLQRINTVLIMAMETNSLVQVLHFMEAFPPDTMQPGDVYTTNDPWKATGHLW